MNDLKIIFVNWTKPFFYKDKFTGYKTTTTSNISSDEYFLPDHEIVMQVAAIVSAKKFGKCPVKLYTDDCGYEYYKKIGIIDLFDEVDTDLLNKISNNKNINASQFWTSGKIISICKEKPPFIFMDLDLIIKDDIPEWFSKYDVVHTHWEICRGPLYVDGSQFESFGIEMPEINPKMMIPNTSFLYVNNQDLLNKYLEMHIRIVNKKYDNVPDWLWLLSDQHILGYAIRELGSSVSEITNKVFVQFPDDFHHRGKPGYIPDWIEMRDLEINSPSLPYEHVWLMKGALISNHIIRSQKIEEWNKIISDNGFGKYVKKRLI
jgi:hypothetical protein